MFKLIFVVSTSWAGVGGISGGAIFFQEQSMFVNPTNRALCQDGEKFILDRSNCLRWEGFGVCGQLKSSAIVQPIDSVAVECTSYQRGQCVKWKKSRFYQSPVREVDIVDHRDIIRGKKQIVIPGCQ